ncbi:hypothetical protein [Loktanella salsilacus]|uniref:hypothetical protein n=1 Tax=Loktanella salsilacus TaxID=195913 RepID=UPI003002C979
MSDLTDRHSKHSSVREEYAEYILLGQLCSHAWRVGRFIEIARSQTDAFGYDVILTCDGLTRHVQLKTMKMGAKTSFQKVSRLLEQAPSGCVIWSVLAEDTLLPVNYGWFGGQPGEKLPPLGDEVARHTKGNKDGHKTERQNHRKVKKAAFCWIESTNQVFEKLFGK